MIQIGTICISEPVGSSPIEKSKNSLFVMEANVRRMRYMIECGYFCQEYSDEEWQKFRKLEILQRNL